MSVLLAVSGKRSLQSTGIRGHLIKEHSTPLHVLDR